MRQTARKAQKKNISFGTIPLTIKKVAGRFAASAAAANQKIKNSFQKMEKVFIVFVRTAAIKLLLNIN
jgi:hypothetical protein